MWIFLLLILFVAGQIKGPGLAALAVYFLLFNDCDCDDCEEKKE